MGTEVAAGRGRVVEDEVLSAVPGSGLRWTTFIMIAVVTDNGADRHDVADDPLGGPRTRATSLRAPDEAADDASPTHVDRGRRSPRLGVGVAVRRRRRTLGRRRSSVVAGDGRVRRFRLASVSPTSSTRTPNGRSGRIGEVGRAVADRGGHHSWAATILSVRLLTGLTSPVTSRRRVKHDDQPGGVEGCVGHDRRTDPAGRHAQPPNTRPARNRPGYSTGLKWMSENKTRHRRRPAAPTASNRPLQQPAVHQLLHDGRADHDDDEQHDVTRLGRRRVPGRVLDPLVGERRRARPRAVARTGSGTNRNCVATPSGTPSRSTAGTNGVVARVRSRAAVDSPPHQPSEHGQPTRSDAASSGSEVVAGRPPQRDQRAPTTIRHPPTQVQAERHRSSRTVRVPLVSDCGHHRPSRRHGD